jgi:hypothetical protein
MKERKQDAHEKIQLGGLVVKAGLREMDKNVILGMLMDGVRNLEKQNGIAYRDHYKELGDKAFSSDS